eukprot:TRINITY_DN8864_c0_g1_i1.p1 TRINITY_DN8864_c0_g1~~TRINITY_DN8864_c0_g1_i1.p1  ORF type:complete len:669 (+),score=130.83 TRINITY_DN8864_c0_g1_i1:43-2049(+)
MARPASSLDLRPIDRVATKTVRWDVGKYSFDQITTRLRQLKTTYAHAEGSFGELLGLASWLQRELQQADTALRASQRSVQLEQQARADANERSREQASIAFSMEQMRFIPPADVEEASIQQQLAELETEIAKQSKLAGEAVPRPPSRQARPSTPAGRVQSLLDAKFRALDTLVMILRKRIARFEEQKALAESVERFGSIRDLLADNERLRSENEKLRLRETRYATDPLLKRYALNRMPVLSMRTLILALQNELSTHRKLVNAHDLEENPAQKWLVQRLAPDVLPVAAAQRIDSMIDMEEDEYHDALQMEGSDEESSWGQGRESSDIVARELQTVNMQLRNRVEELEKYLNATQVELDHWKRVKISDIPLLPIERDQVNAKRLHTKELKDQNERLHNLLQQREQEVADLSESCEMLRNVASDAQQARAESNDHVLRISQKARGLLHRIREQVALISELRSIVNSERTAALTLAMTYLEQHIPRPQRRQILQVSYRDLVSHHLRMSRAALMLQRHWRGVAARAHVERRYGKRFRKPAPGSDVLDLESPPRRHDEPTSLHAFENVQRLLLAITSDARTAVGAQGALRSLKSDVLGKLKQQTTAQLRHMNEDLQRTFAAMSYAVAKAHPPTHEDGVQAVQATCEAHSSAVAATGSIEIQTDDGKGAKPGAKK